MTLKVTDN